MENLAIDTTQNVAIEQPVASVGERIVAGLIDLAIVVVYVFVMSLVVVAFKSPLLYFILFIPVLLYHISFETAMGGQSPGKKVMKIRVVKLDGTQASFTTYFIRWVFRLIDILIFFGGIATLVIIVNGKGQRLGDIAAGSAVIRTRVRQPGSGIFVALPVNYSQVFTQVSRLVDSDILTAREIVDFLLESHNSPASVAMAAKARKAIETKMGVSSELDDFKFLKTVIYDYNYLHSR